MRARDDATNRVVDNEPKLLAEATGSAPHGPGLDARLEKSA